MNQDVTEYIAKAPVEQQKIMNTLRSLIHESVGNVTEEYKWSRPIFTVRSKSFAYLQANKNHVNLGFYSGFERLNDPGELLEGTGKMMRHIKLKSEADINSERLKEWFSELTTE